MPAKICWFITPHGFGHAARSAAILQALGEQIPPLEVTLFTSLPAWFFEASLSFRVRLVPFAVDPGFVQYNSFQEDLSSSLKQWQSLLPYRPQDYPELLKAMRGADLVVCDIAPLGLVLAKHLGICSLLIENFTWDWIFRGYPQYTEQTKGISQALQEAFGLATWRIKTKPYCEQAQADLITNPVCRPFRQSRAEVRQALGLKAEQKLVIISTGGVLEEFNFGRDFHQRPDCLFVVPGARRQLEQDQNLLLLPQKSSWYHPDLIRASDLVIGKIGYSTTAEVFHAGVPFGFVSRESFPESEPMTRFVKQHMKASQISEKDFRSLAWISALDELLAPGVVPPGVEAGSRQAARFVGQILSNAGETA